MGQAGDGRVLRFPCVKYDVQLLFNNCKRGHRAVQNPLVVCISQLILFTGRYLSLVSNWRLLHVGRRDSQTSKRCCSKSLVEDHASAMKRRTAMPPKHHEHIFELPNPSLAAVCYLQATTTSQMLLTTAEPSCRGSPHTPLRTSIPLGSL